MSINIMKSYRKAAKKHRNCLIEARGLFESDFTKENPGLTSEMLTIFFKDSKIMSEHAEFFNFYLIRENMRLDAQNLKLSAMAKKNFEGC